MRISSISSLCTQRWWNHQGLIVVVSDYGMHLEDVNVINQMHRTLNPCFIHNRYIGSSSEPSPVNLLFLHPSGLGACRSLYRDPHKVVLCESMTVVCYGYANLQIFANPAFGIIHAVTVNHAAIFAIKDGAITLGWKTPWMRSNFIAVEVTQYHPIVDNLGRTQEIRFITKGAAYRLISRATCHRQTN